MKVKLTKKLKELYPNLGLSDALFASVGEMAAVGLEDDADDVAIEARAKSFESILKAFQKDTDKRVSEAVKKVTGNKGDDKDPKNNPDEGMPEWFKVYSQKKDEEQKALLDKISALEGKSAQATYDELVAKVAGELGLTGNYLTIAKRGLSADMTEEKIKEEMGAVKKMMAEAGATFDEQIPGYVVSSDEVARQAAKDWVKENAVK